MEKVFSKEVEDISANRMDFMSNAQAKLLI